MMDLEFVDYHLTNIDVSSSYKDYMLCSGITLPQALSKACLKRQCEFLAGRYCANHALQKLGEQPQIIPIGQFREPQWPSSIVGSISHCRTQAVAVCAKKSNFQSIGVDLEHYIANDIAEKIGPQIVSGSEHNFRHYFHSYAHFITCIFSAKEAVFKAIFPLTKQPINFGNMQLQGIDNNEMTFSLAQQFKSPFTVSQVVTRNDWFDEKVFNICTIANN